MTNYAKSAIKGIVARYGTADPFIIAEKLNVDYYFMPLGNHPLGDTSYDNHEPIIILNESIHDSPQRYFTLAHEIGHVVMHADLNGYHSGYASYGVCEYQANQFATGLMGLLYVEENGYGPDSYYDLVHHYGSPVNELD
ncbi:MAG: ImmA/IrrE family metallo-endopeptidase [Lactobacillus sp.]|nr:ImmA/IrrE family metallo-endopeptidase [Lactobacillus sp.]